MLDDIKAIENPNESDGQVTSILNNKETKQVDFYLPDKQAKGGADLACSLIPCPSEDISPSNCDLDHIRSVLENLDRTKPVVILLHGNRSWRHQVLHCTLASKLSSTLSCHTLRFDFTANGQSGDGKNGWIFADFDQNYEDLCRVVDFVKDDLKLSVSCILGHSMGSAAVWKYASEHDEPKNPTTRKHETVYVNLSGSYYGHGDGTNLARLFYDVFTAEKRAEYNATGKCVMEVKGGREYVVTTEDVKRRDSKNYESDSTLKKIRNGMIFTLHGTKDSSVLVSHGEKFGETVRMRNHKLEIVDGADHNFNGTQHIEFILKKIAWFIKFYTAVPP